MGKIARWGKLALGLALFLIPFSVWAKPVSIDRYVIGDRKDWGFPAPYFHYPRGPGYLRMSMPILPKHLWEKTTPKTIDRKKAGIGCGPYLLKGYDPAEGA